VRSGDIVGVGGGRAPYREVHGTAYDHRRRLRAFLPRDN
jgi:hypothetical protein